MPTRLVYPYENGGRMGFRSSPSPNWCPARCPPMSLAPCPAIGELVGFCSPATPGDPDGVDCRRRPRRSACLDDSAPRRPLVSISRRTQAALLPAVVQTPEELAAAHVVMGRALRRAPIGGIAGAGSTSGNERANPGSMRVERAIGEIALINNVPRAATVAAQTPTLALLFSTRRTLS
jgi:hypothetical protein